MVLIYHAGVPALSGGFLGVDVFFVISGFLITTHLVKSLDRGSLRFADFWSRRVRRLLPAAWTVAAITAVLGALLFAPLYLPAMLRQAAASFAYIPNVLFAAEGVDYLANPTPSAFQHYWPLGWKSSFTWSGRSYFGLCTNCSRAASLGYWWEPSLRAW